MPTTSAPMQSIDLRLELQLRLTPDGPGGGWTAALQSADGSTLRFESITALITFLARLVRQGPLVGGIR